MALLVVLLFFFFFLSSRGQYIIIQADKIRISVIIRCTTVACVVFLDTYQTDPWPKSPACHQQFDVFQTRRPCGATSTSSLSQLFVLQSCFYFVLTAGNIQLLCFVPPHRVGQSVSSISPKLSGGSPWTLVTSFMSVLVTLWPFLLCRHQDEQHVCIQNNTRFLYHDCQGTCRELSKSSLLSSFFED